MGSAGGSGARSRTTFLTVAIGDAGRGWPGNGAKEGMSGPPAADRERQGSAHLRRSNHGVSRATLSVLWLAYLTASGSKALRSPGSVGALRGDGKGDAGRCGQKMANPVDERFVGVAHPLAQMHELEPGFNGERLQEASIVGDVLVNAPGIGPVAPPRVAEFV